MMMEVTMMGKLLNIECDVVFSFSCGTNVGNPERARWVHLALLDSQSERRIRFILPARRFSHITRAKL